MSIHDFHSKLSSRNECNALFEALRQVRRIRDIRGLLFNEETTAGWNPWTDGTELPRHVAAEA